MIVRPATPADMLELHPEPLPRSARVQAAEANGRPIAIWGVYPENAAHQLFASFSPEFRASKRNFVKGIEALKAFLAQRPAMPVYAYEEETIPNADVLLRHIGFTNVSGRDWIWTP